jgi:hypothetical protein
MGDETWVFRYDPEMKTQYLQWKNQGSLQPKKKVQQCPSKVKTVLIIFFDFSSIVQCEFISPHQTVNQEFYKGILEGVREAGEKESA